MANRILLLCITSLIFIQHAVGNVGFSYVLESRHSKVYVRGDWGPPENRNKGEILASMLDDFDKEYFNDTLNFIINIEPSDSFSAKYTIGYNEFGFICLRATKTNFNPIECLTILDYAAKNKNKIVSINHRIDFCGITKGKKKDSLWCVLINEILSTHKPDFQKILSKKYYAYSSYLGYEGVLIDYYYCNNTYTVYKLVDKKRPTFKGLNQAERFSDTIGIPILELDDIYEIAGDSLNDYFIFSRVDTFYHYSKKVSGPYHLPLLRHTKLGREYIRSNIRKKGVEIIIPVDVYISPYNVIYNNSNHSVSVDSSSIKEDLWDEIKFEKERELKIKEGLRVPLLTVKELKKHQQNAMLLVGCILILNGVLIYKLRAKKIS